MKSRSHRVPHLSILISSRLTMMLEGVELIHWMDKQQVRGGRGAIVERQAADTNKVLPRRRQQPAG